MRRRRKRRKRRGLFAELRRRPSYVLVALALYPLLVNGAIRATGGEPGWLSLACLPDKTIALTRLGAHLLGHAKRCPQSDLQRIVAGEARAHRVPIRLALAVARAESDLRPHAISHTGAMGLMQLMPHTADELGVADPFDARDNARGAARYLRILLDRYAGDTRRAVWAYNRGPGNVPRHGPVDLPAETRAYASRVFRAGL